MRKEIVFMAGVPGAGKTTLANERYGDTHSFIRFPLKGVEDFHPERDMICGDTLELRERMDKEVWNLESAERWVFDGSETPISLMIELIDKSRRYGFRAKVVFLHVDPEVAIERNAWRDDETKVLEVEIRSQAENSDTAVELLRPHPHHFEEVDNRGKKGVWLGQ